MPNHTRSPSTPGNRATSEPTSWRSACDERAGARGLLRLHQVLDLTGLSRTPLYRAMAGGEFPRPVKLGSGRAVGWVEAEVLNWISSRIAERDQSERGAGPGAAV